jgi:hypothetical protein
MIDVSGELRVSNVMSSLSTLCELAIGQGKKAACR